MKLLFTIAALVLFAWAITSCQTGKPAKAEAAGAMPSQDSLVKRGAYLVNTTGCNDCHSPKKMGPHGQYVDTALALSGFPANGAVPVAAPADAKNGLIVFNSDLTACVGPWGTTFAANITSDATGIGAWKEDQFKNAIRHGKYKGLDAERMIMPPMPWEGLRKLTDADINAIFCYLKSTKPVKNVPPSFIPAPRS
jgi:hypothetical protein